MRHSILIDADLTESTLIGADMQNAVLADMQSTGFLILLGGGSADSSLMDANLYNANLVWATLNGAIVGNANLSKANLFGTVIGNTLINVSNLKISYNYRYILPSHIQYVKLNRPVPYVFRPGPGS